MHGGNGPARYGFRLELVGSDATLTATPAVPGTFIHWGDWDIRIGGETVAVPDSYRTVPVGARSGPPANVAALYQEVARAITEARQPHPNFDTAWRHHRLLTAIEHSAAQGTIRRTVPTGIHETDRAGTSASNAVPALPSSGDTGRGGYGDLLHNREAVMNPAVAQLISIMPPPPRPPIAQTPWVDVERAMGVRLPTDYRQFIDTYGDGRIDQTLSVFFPARRGALRPSFAVLSDHTASLHATGFFDEAGDDPVFATAVRHPGDLLLWGQTRPGDLLFWSTQNEDPDQWTVILFLQSSGEGPRWLHYDQGMAQFLVGVVSHTIPESASLIETTADDAQWTRMRDWPHDYGHSPTTVHEDRPTPVIRGTSHLGKHRQDA